MIIFLYFIILFVYIINFLLPNIIENAVFFGDRIVDEQFAKNSNMQFQKVYNMIGVF